MLCFFPRSASTFSTGAACRVHVSYASAALRQHTEEAAAHLFPHAFDRPHRNSEGEMEKPRCRHASQPQRAHPIDALGVRACCELTALAAPPIKPQPPPKP